MISLEKAVEIAEEYFRKRDLFIRYTCRDFGDSWVFEWGWRNSPNESDTSGWLLRVSKDNGRITDFDLGVPGTENFERFMSAPESDISRYIDKDDLELGKIPIDLGMFEKTEDGNSGV